MTGLIGKMTRNNWIFKKCEILKRVQKFFRLISVIDFWMAMTGITGKMTEKSIGELKLKASYYYSVVCHQKLGELFAVHSANVFPVSLLMLMEYVLAVQTFQTCHHFESAFF